MRFRRLAAAAAAGFALLAAAPPAAADCYDVIGCSERDPFAKRFDYLASATEGPTCEFLKEMRQAILADHGDADAFERDDGAIPRNIALSPVERANFATIRRAEAMRRCRGG